MTMQYQRPNIFIHLKLRDYNIYAYTTFGLWNENNKIWLHDKNIKCIFFFGISLSALLRDEKGNEKY